MRKQDVLLLALAAVLSLGFAALPWGPDVLVERGWIERFDADTSEDGTIYVATTVWGQHSRHEEVNLDEPITIVNQVLQGKPGNAAGDTMRFGFNTIFGVFGLMDVATGWGLEKHNEDFGQTFGV